MANHRLVLAEFKGSFLCCSALLLVLSGIYVSFNGFCNVDSSKEFRCPWKNYDAREDYISRKTYLIGSENGKEIISPGLYEYSFNFVIPQNCPSSYEGKYGHIRYRISTVMNRAFKSNKENVIFIHVIAPLDLNLLPNLRAPIEMKFDETYYCCWIRSGSMTAVFKLPYSGFIAGQTVQIDASVHNIGSVSIDKISLYIIKDTKYLASGIRSEKSLSCSEVAAHVSLDGVRAGTSNSFTAEMLIPELNAANLRNCTYIDEDYRFKVTFKPDGCHRKVSQSRSIVIGTIPLAGTDYPSGGQDQKAHHNEPVVTQPPANPYPGDGYHPSNTPLRPLVTFKPDGCRRKVSQSRSVVIGTIPLTGTDYPSGGQDQKAHQNEPVVTQPLANPDPGDGYYPSNTPLYPLLPSNPYTDASAPMSPLPDDQ